MNHITPATYGRLHSWVFSGRYPGYKSDVTEAPHGDGNWDYSKRFAHIALKYLSRYDGQGKSEMENLLYKMTDVAREAAIQIGLPPEFWPVVDDCNIRILEYGPGVVSAPHTDFDLFTLPMWRNIANGFRYVQPAPTDKILDDACDHYPGIHFGELMPLIDKVYTATAHKVLASKRYQYSAVFFVMPRLDVVLPDGRTVGEWLEPRKKRARKTA